MQIVFNFSDSPASAKIWVVNAWRLSAVLAVIIVLFSLLVYWSAVRVAAHWIGSENPIIAELVNEEINTQRRQLWLQQVDELYDDIVMVRSDVISLQRKGAEIADYLGLSGEEMFPLSGETTLCPAAVDAVEGAAATMPPDGFKKQSSMVLSRQTDLLAVTTKKYDVLYEHSVRTAVMEKTLPMKRPVLGRNWYVSGYGYRTDPFTGRRAFHSGVDYAAPTGTPVIAGASGIVTYRGRLGGYGNVVQIYHGENLSTLYAHLKSMDVELLQYVNRGDVIGGIGSTGRSTGPHLHYEIRINNRPRPINKTLRELRKIRNINEKT